MADKQRLYVDMDGTLAVFTPVDELERLYEKGYFLNQIPHEKVVAAIREIRAAYPEIEVNILSAYLTDSQYALQEKNQWLDKHLPEIDQSHRIFVPCGSDKKEGIVGGVRENDFLLDDYTRNLNEWQPPARGIKLLNAINHTRGSWAHDRIRYDRSPQDLANKIVSIMRDKRRIFDKKSDDVERGDFEDMAQEETTDIKGLQSKYSLQELQDMVSQELFVEEPYDKIAITTAIETYPQRVSFDVYRKQVQLICDYEVEHHFSENERMTSIQEDTGVAVAKAYYKLNDPSVMRNAEDERFIRISEASINQRYAEVYAEIKRQKINEKSESERSTQKMAQEEYIPSPNRYYEPELDLDGTAEEFYIQARNNYIENPDILHRISEILSQEGRMEEAERVSFMEERERELNTELYSVAQMKLDFMDGNMGGGVDDIEIGEGHNLTVQFEPHDSTVIVALRSEWQDGDELVLSTGASSIPLNEFKQMSRADFERFVGEVNAYSMIEQERIPFPEKVQELNHGDENEQELNHGDDESPPLIDTLKPVEIDDTLPPKDQLKQRLENGVRQVLDSEMFKNWLSTGGKLFYNNYSFRNTLLVWLQKPEASYVMGYEKWKDFGRNVAQGAQGAKIFIPLMAREQYKGGLFRSIKSNLSEQLAKNPAITEASYRLGTSTLEFTMNRANHLVGFKVNGREQQIFGSDEEAKRFIDRTIIGKVPTGFTVGTVFDAKDVIIPEYLWVKSGFTKQEIAPDEKGNAVKNKRGETRIINTPERQARFQTDLDTQIVAKDPVKMQILFDVCCAAAERKGVPVSLSDKSADSALAGGATGYYSRETSAIVIDSSLEITEKCAVLFHEMGHADLHKNLEALAKSMGEDKITKNMKEVQAEAVAFATASTFGIKTGTSSFNYLSIYARGFELQDFQKSLDVIYKETQALTKDIKAELDIRGLNLDLTEEPKEMLNAETIKTLSTKYMDFATERGNTVQAALKELPSLVKQSANNDALIDILKYQKLNLDGQSQDLNTMLTAVERLNDATTREAQDEAVSTLDSATRRVEGSATAFEGLSERYIVVAELARGGLKVDFDIDPMKTLQAMKRDFPALATLSDKQLQYVASSKIVARDFVKMLRDNPQGFVDKVTERAALLSKAASKNGTFVEINLCEQWTDTPFFEKGTLCSPKIADKTIAACEVQVHGFKEEAAKRGEYFPYMKCDMTIFTPSQDGRLLSYNTRVDIGDGEQVSLKDHLEQMLRRGTDKKEMMENFTEALTERADKRKVILQDLSGSPRGTEATEKEVVNKGTMSREDWDEAIQETKEINAQKETEPTQEKTKIKTEPDRTE